MPDATRLHQAFGRINLHLRRHGHQRRTHQFADRAVQRRLFAQQTQPVMFRQDSCRLPGNLHHQCRHAGSGKLCQCLAQRQVRIHRQHIACCQIMQTKWNHGIGQNRLSLLKLQVNPDSIPVPANLRAIVAAQC